MKAVSFEGKHKMSVANHPTPKLQSPTDALLRVTTTGICGSDLHMYDGRTPLEKGTVVGHEIMGVIEQVGEAVQSIKKSDRVVLPFNIACGLCFNCHRGHTEACLTMNPEAPHAAYGYAGMGPYQGGQAEFVLVPYADFDCLKPPGEPGDEWEDDFLLAVRRVPDRHYHASGARVRGAGQDCARCSVPGPWGCWPRTAHCSRARRKSTWSTAFAERLEKAKETRRRHPGGLQRGRSGGANLRRSGRKDQGNPAASRAGQGEEKAEGRGLRRSTRSAIRRETNDEPRSREGRRRSWITCVKVVNATGGRRD